MNAAAANVNLLYCLLAAACSVILLSSAHSIHLPICMPSCCGPVSQRAGLTAFTAALLQAARHRK